MKKIFSIFIFSILLLILTSCNMNSISSSNHIVNDLDDNGSTGETAKDAEDDKKEITEDFNIESDEEVSDPVSDPTQEDNQEVEESSEKSKEDETEESTEKSKEDETEEEEDSKNKNTYMITSSGEYTLSGVLNGMVYVNVPEDEEVKLILNNVIINNDTNSCIYIEQADKVVINSSEGSYNEINDNRPVQTVDDDTQGAGAIYAKCDLNISGSGSLVVNGNYNNGIHTKDDLKVKNVTLKVTAVNNALKGNDSVTIESGNLTIISTGGDGIKTDNSDVSSKGNQRGTITITGGTIDIYAACDGIDASYDVIIEEDDPINLNIYTDKYSEYTGEVMKNSTTDMYLKITSYLEKYRYAVYFYNDIDSGVWANASYYEMTSSRGSYAYYYKLAQPSGYTNMKVFRFLETQEENSLETYDSCTSGSTINTSRDTYYLRKFSNGTITGEWTNYSSSQSGFGGMGGFDPNSSGNTDKSDYSTKGIKADNKIEIKSGNIYIKANDDSIHVNGDVTLENSETSVATINISGGTITVYTLDDGIHADNYLNITGGTITVLSSYEGIEANVINISDGSIAINASDDGINAANCGSLSPAINISGGAIDITVGSGDVDAIDSNGTYKQTGGLVICRTQSSSQTGTVLDTSGTKSITGGTYIGMQSGIEGSVSSSLAYISFGYKSSMGGGGFGGFGGRGGGSSSSSVSIPAGTYTISGTNISFKVSTTISYCVIYSSDFTSGTSYTITSGSNSFTTKATK